MSGFKSYYEEELSFLREEGRLFAERFPQLAPFLGENSQDPDIERLLEGFAFLSAKLQCKIKDAHPELSQQFLELVAPSYFRPQPSCTIIQFHPNPAMAAEIKRIPRGTSLVMTKGQNQYGLSTSYDLAVQPLQLVHFEQKRQSTQMVLTLSFHVLNGADTRHLEALSFFLQGELQHSYGLSFLLLQHLSRIEFCVEEEVIPLEQARFERLGFKPQEGILPYFGAAHCFDVLRDYFSFPEKFLFMNLLNIDFSALPRVKQFSLKLYLKDGGRSSLKVSQESFLLTCTPAVNVWRADAEPLWHESAKIDYLLKAQTTLPGVAVHSLLSVKGWSETKKCAVEYQPAAAFPIQQDELRRYQPKLKASSSVDHPELYSGIMESSFPLDEEVIVPEILAYQPWAFLGVNGRNLLQATQAIAGLDYTQILPFSLPLYPPLQTQASWQVITHLALRFKNLQDLSSLKQLVLSYDFAAFQPERAVSMGRRIVEALLECTTHPHHYFYKGERIKGFLSRVKIKEDVFLNHGEAYLFGTILAHILAEHASFNSFHELELHGVLTGLEFAWPLHF